MAELTAENLEAVLRHIASAGPEPWYPKLHAESSGVARDSLDAPLEKLRLAGLIRLTDWVKDRGQGYLLTPDGMKALNDGKMLARVRDGKVSRPAAVQKPRDFRGETAWDRGERIRDAFLYPRTPFVTRFLLFAYIAVFMAGMVLAQVRGVRLNFYLFGQGDQGVSNIIHDEGAVNGVEIIRGQWWRLLTACFVHIGILHLGLNSWGLYSLGRFLEPLLGPVRFAMLYVLAGLGGSCVALITSPMPGCAGGSGALCGLLGGVAVWVVLHRSYLPAPIVGMLQRNIAVNVVLMVFISMVPGVSWGGHLGGAVFGVLAALLLHYQRYGSAVVRFFAGVGLLLVPATAVGALLYTMDTQPRWVQLHEIVRAVEASEERPKLRAIYRDEVFKADQAAREAYNNALSILKKEPGQRLQVERKETVESLALARDELDKARHRFSANFSSWKSSDIRDAFKGVLAYLDALSELCTLSEQQLRENRGDEGFESLEKMMQQITDLQKQWAWYLQ